MRPKEYLMQIQRLNVLIGQRLEEKNALREFDGVVGIDYSRGKVQGFSEPDAPYVYAVQKKVALEREIDELVGAYVALKNRIISEIQSLSHPTHTQILYKRYVEFKRLEVIAVEMNYSYDRVRHLHGRALKNFGKIMGKEKDDTQ